MLDWCKINIKSAKDIKEYFCKLELDLVSIDVETTGLHIIKDKPFLMSMAVLTKDKKAYAFTIDINDKTLTAINFLIIPKLSEAKKIIFFNAKYDNHMLYNVNIDLFKDYKDKITDVSILARLSLDAISPREGGLVLRLKTLAQKFIDPLAKVYEHKVATLKKEVKLRQTNLIKNNGFKIKELDKFLKDKTNDISTLPPFLQQIINDETLDPNNYRNVDIDILKEYAIYDAIYTLELYLYFSPIVKDREQEHILLIEEKNIYILWKMERCGFKLNKKYLIESKEKLKKRILELREKLKEISGTNYTISQSKMWLNYFNNHGINIKTTDEESLLSIKSPEKYKQIADIIMKLRSLEKWYSTYICKWEDEYNGRIYTSFNQNGAVSGRFSSDFQQFPKEPLLDDDGSVLYNPRRLVQVSGNGYNKLVFIDFSSEELRLQALYTILIGYPDLNLCRAYMPYKCIDENKIEFDYKTDIKTFKEKKWFLIESPEIEWTPTDLHDKTTFTAFPELTKESPEFKHYRKMAKSTNFACNYGANVKTLISQFGFSEELALRLFNAYNNAFPGIKKYKEYVALILKHQDYISNLFGRRYYNASSHKCCNYLIQGSGADYLKTKLIEIDKYLENYKSRIVCTIHDEIVYEIYDGEEFVIPKIKEIMENFEGSYIPMVSEVEITRTTWDEKK